jgi:outer membrane receptor for ferrienterochelin and colicins
MFKTKPAKLALALQLAMLPALTVQADTSAVAATADSKIERIVVTASGFEQKLVEAPASISVISLEELQTRPFTTLLDAVRDVEGVDVGETRDKTGQGTISMRGMGSDYTLIMIDGKRQNNHGDIYPNNFGGNQFGHMAPLETIERIELIRGPASTLYGADALGGVINIITKKFANEWNGSVNHSRSLQSNDNYGDEITTDFNVMGPLLADTFAVALRGSAYNRMASTPTYAAVTYPNGTVRQRSLGFGAGGKTVDNDSTALGGRLSWKIAENQELWFDIDSSVQKYDNTPIINDDGSREYPVGTVDNITSIWAAGSFCQGATGNNQKACTDKKGKWLRRANPQVGYSDTQEFSRDSWSLSHQGRWAFGNSFAALSYVDTQNHGRTLPFTLAQRSELLKMIDGTGIYAGKTEAERKALAQSTYLPRPKRTMASEQYTFDAKVDLPFEMAGQHTAIVGTQVIRGDLADSVFGMEQGLSGLVQEHNMWSLFAEDTWNTTDALALTAGIRRDDHQVFGSQISPRLYSVYSLSEQWTVKGGVSTGFKTPKTTQLYDGVVGFGGQGTSPIFGNPNLKAETSVSTEIAAYWEHPDRHNFNVTVFNNEFDDKISSQPCGTNTGLVCSSTGEYADLGYALSSTTVNIDKVTITGAEVAGRWQFLETLALRGNYTFTDSEQKSGANKGQPLNNSARHMTNLTLDWEATSDLKLSLVGEIRTKRYRSWDVINQQALYYKAYEVLHLGASYKASPTVTFNARINNLLDQDFTTYDLQFASCTSGTSCFDGIQANYVDDYNNKDKARNLWLSVNVKF